MKTGLSILFACFVLIGMAQDEDQTKGLYLTYQEFATNSPNGTDQFYMTKSPRNGSAWEGTDQIIIRLNESDRKVSNIWGYSDGKQAYIKHRIDFFPVLIANDSLLFYGYGTVTKEDWYTGEYQNPADAKRAKANAIDKAKLVKHKYSINKQSGEVTKVPTHSERAKLTANYMEVVIYRQLKRQRDSTIIITVNDANPTRCSVNSVHSYLVSPDMNGATICLNDDDHTCIDIPFNQKELQYIEVSMRVDESITILRHTKQEEGEWNSKQINSNNQKINKE